MLEIGDKRILVDVGMFQGLRELRELNWKPWPFDLSSIDAVILTHGHTDHIGCLPKLIADGYSGPVYATHGTTSLARISLPDGGRIQEEEADYRNRKALTRHSPALPLFTEADAYRALKSFKSAHYFEWVDLGGGVTFRFLPAGHIIGSAFAEIYMDNGERIVMSGDLGRYDRPILKDPHSVDWGEYLVMESTYGDRIHSEEDPLDILERILQEAVRERQCVLVPSFAIGRTQELLWYLHELEEQGRMPKVPVYVDSPMASAVTLLYAQNDQDWDVDMKLDMREGRSPFRSDMVRFVRDKSMSKQLNKMDGPLVIISGGGMLSGGRIVHHMKSRLGDPNTVVVFTGFQAEGSKGRQILDGEPEVSFHKEMIPVRAQVERMDMLSAHADANEMLKWLSGFREAPKRTFLVHGEIQAQEALKSRIETQLGWEVSIPKLGDKFEL